MFRMRCECGRELAVTGPQAGSTVACTCGRRLDVPELSVLKRSAARNEPIAAQECSSAASVDSRKKPPADIWPSELMFHCFGDIGPLGNVSSAAISNYAGVIQTCIDSFLSKVRETSGFEAVISVAVLPETFVVVEVELFPSEQSFTWRQELEQQVSAVQRPPMQGGPVGFVVYRRVGLAENTINSMRPFSRIAPHSSLEQIKSALQGILDSATSPAVVRPRIWRRLLSRVTRAAKAELAKLTTKDTGCEDQQTWIETVEAQGAAIPLVDLKRAVMEEPGEMAHHMRLAARFFAEQEWDLAYRFYDSALQLVNQLSIPVNKHKRKRMLPLVRRAQGLLLLRQAQTLVKLGKSPAALTACNQAIEFDPRIPEAFHQRALIFIAIGAFNKAIEDLGLASSLAPHEPTFHFLGAQVHRQLEDIPAMISDLQATLQLDPNCGRAHELLGSAFHYGPLRDLPRAMAHYSRAIELMPFELDVRLQRGLAYLADGKLALALEDCNTVLEIAPDFATAHAVGAHILQNEGDYATAITAATRAIDLGHEGAAVFTTRAICYSATDCPELAMVDCLAAVELDPENSLVAHLLGQLKLQAGELDEAKAAFDRARELAPEWALPREHLAYVHRMQENPQAAVDEQTKLIEQQPTRAGSYVNRAFALVELSQFEMAAGDYATAIELEPENEQIYYHRGVFRLARQAYDEALADFDRALTIDSAFANARLYRAHVLLNLKRYDDAISDFSKLIEKFPDDPRASAGRANAFVAMGKFDAMQADNERLEQLDPEYFAHHSWQLRVAELVSLRHQEEYQQALQVAEQMIEAQPQAAIGYWSRAYVRWDLEELVEADEDLTLALDLEAGIMRTQILSSRGQVRAEMGEWTAALEDLDVAIADCRQAGWTVNLAQALAGRSLALYELDRSDESLRDYEESVSLCASNAWVYYQRGLQHFNQGDLPEANLLLGLALELNDPPLSKRKKTRARQVMLRSQTGS